MATNNAVNTSLEDQTGTGRFVGHTAPALLLPSANNFINGFTTTATAAATTTLLVGSNQIQEFTGSTTQTVTLPVTSTLVAGFAFKIINNSSGAVTVNSSGGNPVQVMAANTTLYLTCVLNSGTTAASWNGTYITDDIQALGNYSFSDNIMTVASDTMQFNLPDSTLLLNGSDDTQIAVASTSATGQPLISFYRDISTQIGAVKAGTNSTGDASGGGMFYFNGTSEGPHYFSSETTGTFFTLDPVAGSTLSAGDLTIAGQLFVGTSSGGGDLTITAGELRVGQASGGGSQTIEIFAPTAGMGVFQFVSFDNAGNFFGRLQNTLLSASRTWTLPDASGTIALTSGASGIVNSGTANQLAYYAAGGKTLSGVGPGSAGQLFQSNGSGSAPAYTTATYPATNTLSGAILRGDGTNYLQSSFTVPSSFATNDMVYCSLTNILTALSSVARSSLSTNSTGVPTWLALTDGQIVVGSTAGSPAAATLTAGTGVSITNASNSITIASTGVGSLVWNDVSGTTQAAAVNQGYIISNASLTTVTLPATAAVGSTFAIAGKGAAGWVMQANTGQVINYGSSPTTSAGSLASTNQWDSVTIVCVTANTTFSVIASQGILTVA